MKKLISGTLSLLLCLCLLFTMIPVQAADTSSGSESNTESSTEQENGSDDSTDSDSTTDTDTDTDADTDTDTDEEPEPEPITLTGTMYKKRSVSLKWNADDVNASYKIYRSTSKTSGFSSIATVSGKEGTAHYYDYTLTLGTTYYYKVEKLVNDEVLTTSNTVSVRIRLLPPENLKTEITSWNYVKLTWDKSSYATSYIIFRSNTKNGTYKKIGTSTTTEYIDKTAPSAESYYYKIRAWKNGVSSAQSVLTDSKVAYTKTKKPVVTAKYSSSKVVLSWKKVTRASKYYVYRRNAKGVFVKIGETTNLTYSDKNVSKDKYYSYKVRGVYKLNGNTIAGFFSSATKIFTSKIDPSKKMVALTFDDGPGSYTDEIVDCLKEYGGHATFFVVGNRVSTYADELKYAYDNGNEIGNHTYSHPTLTSLSVSSIKSQVSKTDAAIKKVTGATTTLMRAPGGATNSTVRGAISKPFIYWSIDTLDWKHRNSTTTVNTVMNNVKDGDIVLMHDIHSPTKTAALQLIPKLVKAGYQLVTVSDLAKYRGYTMQNGTTYYSFR